MRNNYYDYDYDYDFEFQDKNDNYCKILNDHNPENVDTISMLRHFRNVWGYGTYFTELAEYNGVTVNELDYLCEHCRGKMMLSEAIDDFDNIVESEREKEKHLMDNEHLVEMLSASRKTYCGVGTKKVKLFLNKRLKEGDKLAELYRVVLEAEDKNITAKDTDYYYRDKVYTLKHKCICALIELCDQWNKEFSNGTDMAVYGIGPSQAAETTYVIYFDLPHMRQISFHFSPGTTMKLPEYQGEWDGEINSSLGKIEETLLAVYPEISSIGKTN